MKKLLSLLLVLILCFSLAACGNGSGAVSSDESSTEAESEHIIANPNPEENGSTPLLYKITDKDGNYCYLFGTIHVGEDWMYPLPDYVYSAIDDSDAVALEVDSTKYENDYQFQTEMLREYLYYDGSKITDYISDDLYKKAKKILTDKGYTTLFPTFDSIMPSYWEQIITQIYMEELGVDYEKGLEDHLTKCAKEKGKAVIEVEDAFDHATFQAYYSYELQEYRLEAIVEEYNDEEAREETKKELKEALRIWASGDEQEQYKSMRANPQFEDIREKRLDEEYNAEMLTRRDHIMAEFIAEALANGDKNFVAVGAAHVVGENSVTEILREFGYTVEVISKNTPQKNDTTSSETETPDTKPSLSFAA